MIKFFENTFMVQLAARLPREIALWRAVTESVNEEVLVCYG